MTFHLTGGEDPGRVVLRCDLDGCGTQFGMNSVAAHKTRAAAERNGWKPATREDRRDFCPEHVAGEVVAETPMPRPDQCGATFGANPDEWCTKTPNHDAITHANDRYIWGPDVADLGGLDEYLRPAETARLTGGLLDLLEDVAS